MSRTSALILLGVIIILIPFSGLPIALRSFINVVCGIAVFGIGLSLRMHDVQNETAELPLPPTPPSVPPAVG